MANEPSIMLDPAYKDLLTELKEKVQTAQLRAARVVNHELIKLYWEIGGLIIERRNTADWGSKFLEQVSRDLCSAFPQMRGFSRSNVHSMLRFVEVYLFLMVGNFEMEFIPNLFLHKRWYVFE